jgi:hypothetical protein
MLRKPYGSSSLEIAIVGIFLVPFVLIIVDAIILTFALATNESICREAARLASVSNPKDAREKVEGAIVGASSHVGGIISGFEIANISSTVTDKDLQDLKPFGGAVNGNVTVATNVVVHPLIIQCLYLGRTPLKFRAEQTFPYTYQMPTETYRSLQW